MSKKCPKCKAEIDEDAKVCPHCNEPLTLWEQARRNREKRAENRNSCCGCTMPAGCLVASTPFLLTVTSFLSSMVLYSVGVVHSLFSLLGFKNFYQKCIRFYQNKISSKTTSRCNLDPTCSQYSLEAVEKHGIWKGIGLTVNRLRQCAEASDR